MKLSVIIPSYKDKFLVPTIESVLSSFELGNEFEVIVVFDGYYPKFKLPDDGRIRYAFLGSNRGMRGAINVGMLLARGEFVMKTDEHCKFAPGFGVEMVNTCPEKGLIVSTRYNLDVEKWEVFEGIPTYYERLIIHEGRFAGERWRARDKARVNFPVDENMGMQGSCYLMRRDWWKEVIGGLDDINYGPFAQETAEILFKTWKAGGILLLNKNTWYAHKHRKFKRTHHIGFSQTGYGNAYAVATWKEFYEREIFPKW